MLQESGNLFFADPDSTVRIAIGGDKGGDSMKFHFQICHPETSVFDVHIFFCMCKYAQGIELFYR